MVTVAIYSSTGTLGRTIALDIEKSEVNRRLQRAIEGERHGFGPADQLRVDSGRLSLSRLTLLFSPDEIRAGLDRELAKSADAAAIRADIDALLVEWTLAQGGEQAQAGAPKPAVPKPMKKASAETAEDLVKGAEGAWRKSGRP